VAIILDHQCWTRTQKCLAVRWSVLVFLLSCARLTFAGEIDIIEYNGTFSPNTMSLHTSPGCTIGGSGQSGTLMLNDCNVCGTEPATEVFKY
jgi:hypothetical protein